MYLSRLLLNPTSRAVCRDLADCQELHKTIMSAFPQVAAPETAARERFGILHRLDLDRRQGCLTLYVQSLASPRWEFLPPGYLLHADGLENPAVKPVDRCPHARGGEPGF